MHPPTDDELTTGSIEAEVAEELVRDGERAARKATQQDTAARKTVYANLLNGLVDVVQTENGPAYLMKVSDGDYPVLHELAIDAVRHVPFPASEVPWSLPRRDVVLEAIQWDTVGALFTDLRAYVSASVALPDDRWADILAAYVLLTYRAEDVHHLPILYVHGVPERGKTRLAKAVTAAAYRGFISPGIREAVLIRWRDYHGATIALDMENVGKQAARAGVEDLLLASFERDGRIARVLWPEKGPGRDMRHYRAYGPTLLISNAALRPDSALATRCLPLVLPEAGDRDFGPPPTPEDGLPLRERCVAWRARTMGTPLPEVAKPVKRRLGDIVLPLLQVLSVVAPERIDPASEFVRQLEEEIRGRRSESFEGRILESLLALSGEVGGGYLLLKRVREKANEGADASDLLSPRTVGRIVRDLGLGVRRGTGGARSVVWDGGLIYEACRAFGVEPGDASLASLASLDFIKLSDRSDYSDATAGTPPWGAKP